MDEVIDRINEVIQALLPPILTKLNAHYASYDVARFGVALELKPPEEYSHGKSFNWQALPSIQTYGDSIVYRPYSEGSNVEADHPFVIDLLYDTEMTEITVRMLRRYQYALEKVFRDPRARFLKNQYEKDEYAKEVKMLNSAWGVFESDEGGILDIVRLNISARIVSTKLDKILGI